GAVVVLVVLANDHLIMITAHFPLFFLKIRHFFYRYQLVDPKDPTYNSGHGFKKGVGKGKVLNENKR
ncbi:MAG: hypothetical protein ACRC5A_06880, partial [Enterobacteriaceae bacterium]